MKNRKRHIESRTKAVRAVFKSIRDARIKRDKRRAAALTLAQAPQGWERIEGGPEVADYAAEQERQEESQGWDGVLPERDNGLDA